ncbi:hypothetical protein SEEA0322_08513 [Salmonella enterica subsp. enterica serovar Agona str. 0322]|nr:hypothetical protein SEEA0322_08513 [Salmonella enterica subsp. enterica serovar Agona str. 0322]
MKIALMMENSQASKKCHHL